MGVWQMSISGSMMILGILAVRGLFRRKLPADFIMALWSLAVLRLLIPILIPSPFSVFSLAEKYMPESGMAGDFLSLPQPGAMEGQASALWQGIAPFFSIVQQGQAEAYPPVVQRGADQTDIAGTIGPVWQEAMAGDGVSIWSVIYLAGLCICAVWYAAVYIRWRREFQTSLPIQDPFLKAWAEGLPIRRRVVVRQWQGASTPLVYGIVHPVILLPKGMEQGDLQQLSFVLAHEYMHIRHWDAVKKVLLVLACCIHWYNPLVWGMCVLANRDMELACDENVIKLLGQGMRPAYALALISMEERRGFPMSWGNGFSKNALEERIVAIMKEKKVSIAAGIVSGALTAGLILLFATSASAVEQVQQEDTCTAVEAGTGRGFQEVRGTAVSEEASDSSVENIDTSSSPAVQITEDFAASGYGDASYSDMAVETQSRARMEVPFQYAVLGITSGADGGWEYGGKVVAVLYDKDNYVLTADSGKEEEVYLNVRRDTEGKIIEIQELSRKEMQEMLKDTGLVLN